MAVIVEFNAETYDEFFKDILEQYPELLDNLKQDFADYISSDRHKLPHYFGKDSPYIDPPAKAEVGLMHIHIAIPPGTFPKNRPQHERKCRTNAPAQDAALVYVRGELYDNHYSLIALLHPNAHGKARDRSTMRYLTEVAERFIEAQYST